jgi:flagellar biosynthetic protein FliR
VFDITIDAAWAAGLLLAMIRVAAFVISSPIYSRAIPAVGRIAMAMVLGFSFAEPVAGSLDLGTLIVAGSVNMVIGVLLGFLTGVVFHLFRVAGDMIDFTSSLSVAAIFDPLSSNRSAVFGRGLNLGALALFFVLGGDRLVVRGLHTSISAVGLTGSIELDGGLADMAVALIGRLMIAAVELAMPALAALFVAELVLGIASRFAPQTNVFILGLPAKILVAFASVTAVLVLVPETFDGVLNIIGDTFVDTVASFVKG